MKFRVDQFSGEHPLINHRKLPEGSAFSAFDCDLVAGDLRAFRAINTISGIDGSGSINRSVFVFDSQRAFCFLEEVNATFGPIQADTVEKNKVFIDSGFKDYPVYSTLEIGAVPVQGPYYGPPLFWKKLGVPAPETPPVVAAGAINNGRVLTVAVDSGTGLMTVTEYPLQNHGLNDGDRVRIEGLNEDWDDVNGNTYTITVVNPVKFTLNNFDTALHADELATPSGTGTWTQEFNSLDLEDRLYVYTLVTDQGEEGPPSPSSNLVTLSPSQPCTVTTSTAPEIQDVQVEFYRIYRTVATSTGSADYYFVAEVPAQAADYIDTLAFIELGEQLPSLDWAMPPTGLKGLISLPNGIMAGFVGRTIYFCEPYQPHAWPDRYTKQLDHTIVAIEAFGQSVVVVTDDTPYVGTGSDPLSITLTRSDSVEPCISRRCCKALGYGVVYPSPNGLMVVTANGSKNILKGVWDERNWRALFDSYTHSFAEVHDNKYYLFFSSNSGEGYGIVFDPNSSSLEISRLTVSNVFGAGVDRDEDRMFFLSKSGAAPIFQEWNPDTGEEFILTDWVSQTFVQPLPCNMGAYQVMFAEAEGSTSLEFWAYNDNQKVYQLKHTATVSDQEPHRLPSGFLAREWKIRIQTDVEVQGVYVAETIEELRGALAN